jgi:phosphopantetheinyl transferase
MPLIYHKQVSSGIAGVWHILENEDDLLRMANPDPEDLEILATYRNESRRKQWLACRVLLGRLMQLPFVRVEYDGNGRPALKGFEGNISFSHTSEYAAVIIDHNKPVGIDIEKLKPRIERVSTKFLNPPELEQIRKADYSPEPEHNPKPSAGIENEEKNQGTRSAGSCHRRVELLYVYWCSKEALYKFYGKPLMDMKNDIYIRPFDYFCNLQGSVTASLITPEGAEVHQLHYETISDHMLVYTLS